MPRKWLKSYLPRATDLQQRGGLSILGERLLAPDLWHLTRQSVSAAFAVGLFVAWIPIPMQMAVAAGLAMLVRCNLPISVALVWISNPLTLAPMLLFAYEIGALLMGETPIIREFQLSAEWLRARLERIWVPVLLGSLVCGVASSLLGWAGMRLFWRWHVVQRWERRRNVRKLRALHAAAVKEAQHTAACRNDGGTDSERH